MNRRVNTKIKVALNKIIYRFNNELQHVYIAKVGNIDQKPRKAERIRVNYTGDLRMG